MLPFVGVVPSPQLIVAVKSAIVADGLASVNVATGPLIGWPVTAVAFVSPVAVSAASATCALSVCSGLVGLVGSMTVME